MTVSADASDLNRSLVVSLLTCGLGTGLAIAVNFATEEGAGLTPWIAVVALTVLSALLAFVLHPPRKRASSRYPPGYGHGHGYGTPPPGYRGGYEQPWRPPPARPRRTVSWVAVIVTFVLIFGGASGVAWAGWYVVSWVAGTESGTDVLVNPVSATAGALTLTVHRVEVTRHLTKVELTAANRGRDSLSLPVFGNCQLNAGGTTMNASPFRSKWPESVAAGQPVRGTIVFGGKPAAGARSATLSFATIFGPGASSITVPDIPLRPG